MRRGHCDECGREYGITTQGVIRYHWAPEGERTRGDWDCAGAGKPPRDVLPDPESVAESRGYDKAVAALRDLGNGTWQSRGRIVHEVADDLAAVKAEVLGGET